MVGILVGVYLTVGFGMAVYESLTAYSRPSAPLLLLVVVIGPPLALACLPGALIAGVPYLVGRLCGNVARRFAEGFQAGSGR